MWVKVGWVRLKVQRVTDPLNLVSCYRDLIEIRCLKISRELFRHLYPHHRIGKQYLYDEEL